MSLAGIVLAIFLYPTHAMHGTSVGYFTIICFPAAFLLLGLTGLRFRHWRAAVGILWSGLAVYLAVSGPVDLSLAVLLAVYLALGLAAGLVSGALRKAKHST